MKNFEQLELISPLHRVLKELGYESPTAVQSRAIPAALAGKDILACAPTGTGKTAAFAFPILNHIGLPAQPVKGNRPLALVLSPTRELAVQISESFREYGQYMRLRHTVVYGGVSQRTQVQALESGCHILVATPGRLLDLLDQRHVELGSVSFLVLDEADRMLDMGFRPALKQIFARLPRERQSLFFSATLPPQIRQFAANLLKAPVVIDVDSECTNTPQRIEQSVKIVRQEQKLASLQAILVGKTRKRSIVFTRTKRGANALAGKLISYGIHAVAIHGNKSQRARETALAAFRQRASTVLVATDVAARGIDVEGVTHVINYDLPVNAESYVHRVGRTGRAGAAGIAVSLCTPNEIGELRAIERLLGSRLTVENPEELLSLSQLPERRKPATAMNSLTAAEKTDNPGLLSARPKSFRRNRQTSRRQHPRASTSSRH